MLINWWSFIIYSWEVINDDISTLPVTCSLHSHAKQWLFYTQNQVDDSMITLQDILGFSDVFSSILYNMWIWPQFSQLLPRCRKGTQQLSACSSQQKLFPLTSLQTTRREERLKHFPLATGVARFPNVARIASFRRGCHWSSFKILPEWFKLKSN